MKNVLIIGQTPDPHIESVTNNLKQRNARVIFFDIYKPEECAFCLNLSNHGDRSIVQDTRIQLSEIDAVWWRVKPYTINRRVKGRRGVWSEFAHREWKSVLESLTVFTPNARWVNPRQSDLVARNKPVQLFIAKELGFKIPFTLISNDPLSVKDFLRANTESIFKVLTWYFEYPDRAIFTSNVTLNHVQSDLDSIKIVPGVFQNRIAKSYELRIITVGEKIFSVRINSQECEETKVDWRRNQFSIGYSVLHLPTHVSDLIKSMNKRLKLLYAAYDLIVTPNNEYYFLEVNPLGQWLWLEHKLGIEISRSVADLLLS